MDLTQAQRDILLNRAVDAVRDRFTAGPDTDPGDVSRRAEVASMAVTDAVTRGGHLHTQIAQLAGCTGLRVIDLISDPAARSRALRVEANAADNYTRLVQKAARENALRRTAAEGYGSVTRVAKDLGVTRRTVYDWIEQAKAEMEASY